MSYFSSQSQRQYYPPQPVISDIGVGQPQIHIPHVGIHGVGVDVHLNPHHSGQYPMGANQRLLEEIRRGIMGEAEAIQSYSMLLEMAPDQLHRTTIQGIIQDERVHFALFSELYRMLAGQPASYRMEEVSRPTSYREGLFLSYEDELKDYTTYRNVYLSTLDQRVRDVFFRAMSDEMKHAVQFSFLYFSLPAHHRQDRIEEQRTDN